MSVARRTLSQPAGWIGVVGVAGSTLLAVAGPWLAPCDPMALVHPPHAPPSALAWLGADAIGRDILSRILHGGAIVLGIALSTAALSVTAGVGLGAAAAWRGGWPDRAVRAATDALLAMPPLLLQLVVAGVVHPLAGARVAWMVALLAATGWMGVARVTRAQVAALSQAGFVTAARAVGLSEAAIVRHHVLPHVAPYALTWAAMGASQALVAEASLSYLGLGLEAPWISWGSMLRDWGVGDPAHELAAPALAILVTSVSWALLADALARALDRRDG